MREAIELLARSRRNDLASDLKRIFDAIDFDALDVMRTRAAERLADEIHECDSIADLSDILGRMAHLLGVAHCTLHVVHEGLPASFTTKVVTTYPDEWVALYVNRRYYVVDPVVQASRTMTQGFYWDRFDSSSPLVRTFWRDAEAYGVGSSGYTLPIVTERGDTIALSLSSRDAPDAFREVSSYHESDVFNLGICLAEAFSRLASEERPSFFEPSDDQIWILRAISAGVDEIELDERAYQFGSFVTLKRSICSLFKSKTLAQAAVLAAKMGLLDNPPLTKADILAARDGSISYQSAAPAAPPPPRLACA